MAGFFGNSMFGHNFQATAFQQNYGNSTGSFGSSKKPEKTLGSGGFGMSGSTQSHDMNGMHGAPGIHRQNSMLSEMTRSKSDKSANPWLFTHTPGHVEDGKVLSLYEKPLEVEKKKPTLRRQSTFGENVEPRRAPSFASDPARMRSKSVSVSSAPGGTGRLPLQRSVSIVDDPTEPMNMDRARPVLRRAQTIAANKERRRSEASIRPKKPLLPLHLPRFGRRKSSKPSPETESKSSGSERTSLSSTPPRSRSNTTSTGPISSPASDPGPSRDRTNSKASIASKGSNASNDNTTEDPEMANLILSLMNPATDEVFEQNLPSNKSKKTEEPSKAVHKPPSPEVKRAESPTTVSKRFQQQLPSDHDNVSMTSGQFTPRSIQSAGSEKSSVCPSPKSAKPTYPGKTFLDGHTPMSVDLSDTESSEPYYDCSQDEDGIPNKKNKKRMPKRKREVSTSTCTDGEDTTSTSDTPILNKPEETLPYRFSNNPAYSYEAETLPIHRRHVIPPKNALEPSIVPTRSKPVNSKAPVKTYLYGSAPTSFENLTITVPNHSIQKIDLKYASDPKDLPNNEAFTADSSESGYATSHKPLSPRDCDIKVLNFVNSLPNHPDMDEKNSELSQDEALNGSETETDTEEPVSPISNLSNVNCQSGSETDTESIRSNDSGSKLEVMKLLESPTEVSARVEKRLKSNQSNKKSKDEDTDSCSSKRKNSGSSQTEVLQFYKEEGEDQGDTLSEKFIEVHEKPVEANVVVIAKESSSPLESPVVENHILKHPNRSPNSFFEKPLLSFRSSTSYQNLSQCVQCIDFLLSCMNVILFLTSAAVIGFALWLLLKNFNVNQMTEILGNNLLQVIIYLSIGGAATAMLAAFCLCCGVRQDKTGLGFYAFTLILVVFAFATAAILSAMFADKLGSIEFKVNFRERLIEKYGVADEKKKNLYFTESWDTMHEEFECCGVEGNENDTHAWAVFKKFSDWYKKQPYKATIYVPQSCCRRNSNTEVCQGSDHNLLGPPVYGPPIDKHYPQKNSNLNTNGCYDLFAKHATIVVAWTALVTGGLAGLYFIVAMLTWVFCLKKSQEDPEGYWEGSYDMEVNNDVFEMTEGTKQWSRVPNGTSENVVLLSAQPVSVHRIPSANPPAYNDIKDKYTKPNNQTSDMERQDEGSDYDDSEHEDTDEDSEDEYDDGQYDPVITRRNMWLSSESRAGHLLSLAIEEEDEEESDNEEKPQGNTAFV